VPADKTSIRCRLKWCFRSISKARTPRPTKKRLYWEHTIFSRLTSDSVLILNCDEDRSQLKNKEIVTKRFLDILTKGLVVPIKRKATKVPKSVIERRIKKAKTQPLNHQTNPPQTRPRLLTDE
jgi:CRISPR/Cas system CMR-associated protein Cmr1 (group 7 of RAMP superfamily)